MLWSPHSCFKLNFPSVLTSNIEIYSEERLSRRNIIEDSKNWLARPDIKRDQELSTLSLLVLPLVGFTPSLTALPKDKKTAQTIVKQHDGKTVKSLSFAKVETKVLTMTMSSRNTSSMFCECHHVSDSIIQQKTIPVLQSTLHWKKQSLQQLLFFPSKNKPSWCKSCNHSSLTSVHF